MAYELGLAALSGASAGIANAATTALVGQLVWTPGLIEARLREIHAGVEALHAEVEGSRAQLGEPFVRGWSLWRDAWLSFWQQYGSPASWTSRIWGGVVDESERFREGLERWRAMVRERGGTVSSPPVPPVERPTAASALGLTDAGGAGVLDSLKPIAIAGAVIAVVGGVVYVLGRSE